MSCSITLTRWIPSGTSCPSSRWALPSFGPRLPPRPLSKMPKTLLSYPTSSRRTECPCATKRFPDLPTRLPRVRLHKSFAKGDTERSFLPSDVLEIAVRQKDQEGSDRNQTADRGDWADWATSVQLSLEAIITTKSDLYGPNGPRYFFPPKINSFWAAKTAISGQAESATYDLRSKWGFWAALAQRRHLSVLA